MKNPIFEKWSESEIFYLLPKKKSGRTLEPYDTSGTLMFQNKGFSGFSRVSKHHVRYMSGTQGQCPVYVRYSGPMSGICPASRVVQGHVTDVCPVSDFFFLPDTVTPDTHGYYCGRDITPCAIFGAFYAHAIFFSQDFVIKVFHHFAPTFLDQNLFRSRLF